MLDYFLEQLEKDIYKCNRVIEYRSLNSYQIRNEINIDEYDDVREINIEDICREMLVLYDEEVYFSSNDYLDERYIDLSYLKLMTKLMEKHRNSILDKGLVEQLKKEIKSYKKEIGDYKDRINEYRDEIKSYKDYIELLKINLETSKNHSINVYQHQEVATTIDVDLKIDEIIKGTRREVLSKNLEDKEKLLDIIDDLESTIRNETSEKVKEGKIKSTLSWLGTKSKNTIELLMPLIQLILEKKL